MELDRYDRVILRLLQQEAPVRQEIEKTVKARHAAWAAVAQESASGVGPAFQVQ